MIAQLSMLLAAWIPLLHPLKLPPHARLWMLLPLVACIAVVYRATRARRVRDMPKATLITFLNILLGMAAIAAAFYVAHQLALRLW